MRNISPVIILLLILCVQSCSGTDGECNQACTEEYRTITVNIKDSNGHPVALDAYKVLHLKTGEDLSLIPSSDHLQLMRKKGSYPIFSDKYVDQYSQQQIKIAFSGFIGEQEVVSSEYIVGADCCHVYPVSGDRELIITIPEKI